MHNELSGKIQKVHNFESLIDFLRDSLNWSIPDKGLEFDDITFDWSAKDLELDADTQARIVRCRQLQLFDLKFDLSAVSSESNTAAEQRIANAINELHEGGMDVEEIASMFGMDVETIASVLGMDAAAVTKILKIDLKENQQPWGIFFIEFNDDVELDACRTLLRRVLRGLVDGPNHNPSLPFWDYDKILFICTTTNFQNIGFACFRGKKSHPIVDDYIPLRHFKLDA